MMSFVSAVIYSIDMMTEFLVKVSRKLGRDYTVKGFSPGGCTLRISGCGCAARTLEPLAYTRASFSWILLPYTTVNSWFPYSSQPTGQFREK